MGSKRPENAWSWRVNGFPGLCSESNSSPSGSGYGGGTWIVGYFDCVQHANTVLRFAHDDRSCQIQGGRVAEQAGVVALGGG